LQECDLAKLEKLNMESELETLIRKERESCFSLREIATDFEALKSEHSLITRGYLSLEK
jgi:hypothetical protein